MRQPTLGDALGIISAVISVIAVGAAFVGVWYTSRHNERMLRLRFEEDERIRKRENLQKTGEELYQLLRKWTKYAPGDWEADRPQIGAWPPEARTAIFLAQEKEKEARISQLDRIETLITIYHSELMAIYSHLKKAYIGLDSLVQNAQRNLGEPHPEEVEHLRRDFLEAKLELRRRLEERLRSL